jgi:hypothetical protein
VIQDAIPSRLAPVALHTQQASSAVSRRAAGHRGDSHLAVWVSAGLSPVAVNVLTELWLGMPLGGYTTLRRGWSEADIAAAVAHLEARGLVSSGEITPAGREFREELEVRTDVLEQPIIDAIGDDLEPTLQTLDLWSATIAASGAFPPGTYPPRG